MVVSVVPDDNARILQIQGGELDGVRILSPLAVDRMLTPSTPPGERNVRGLGWDMDSSFSSNRGELLPIGSFGHTGWTGTSLWLDPAGRSFVTGGHRGACGCTEGKLKRWQA